VDGRITRCLEQLEAVEKLLEETGDHASLAHLALAIDVMRRRHGLADRPIELLMLDGQILP